MSRIIISLMVLLFCLNCKADDVLEVTVDISESGIVSGAVVIENQESAKSNDFGYHFFLMPFDKVNNWTTSEDVSVFLIDHGKNYTLFLALFPLHIKKLKVGFDELFRIEIPTGLEAGLQLDLSYPNLSGKADTFLKSEKFQAVDVLKVNFEKKYAQSDLSYDPGKIKLINQAGQTKTLFLGSHSPFDKKVSIVFPSPYQESQKTTSIILTIGLFFFTLIASLSAIKEIKKNKIWLTISFIFSFLLTSYLIYYYYFSGYYDSKYLEVIVGALLNSSLWILVYISEIDVVKLYLKKIKPGF